MRFRRIPPEKVPPDFTNFVVLPARMRLQDTHVLERAGVRFGGSLIGHRRLFRYAELPQGWRTYDDGNNFSLYDERGRRRAYGSLSTRRHGPYIRANRHLLVATEKDEDSPHVTGVRAVVIDIDPDSERPSRLFETRWSYYTVNDEKSGHQLSLQAKAIAVAWLDENYPGWQEHNLAFT